MDLDLNTLHRDIMRSLGFLSRIPIAASWFTHDDGQLSNTCRAFPIAAAIICVPAICVLTVSEVLIFPPLLAAALTVCALIITTGALHDDGIADVADGFYGGRDKDHRLEIMKDSRIGTYGALALIIAFSARTIAIAAIFQASLVGAILAVIAASVASRGAMIWHWSELDCARLGGTSDKVGAPTEEAATFALITAIGISLLCALAARGILPTIIAFGFTMLTAFAFRKLALTMIGGQTGDTLGASVIIAEITFLTGLASSL